MHVRLRASLVGNGLGRTLAVCQHFTVVAGGGSLDFTDGSPREQAPCVLDS